MKKFIFFALIVSSIFSLIEWTEAAPFAAMLDYQYDLLPVGEAKLAAAPSVDDPGAWISSFRLDNGALYVRLAEITGQAREVTLKANTAVKDAAFADLLDNITGKAELLDGGVKVALGANGVKTVRFSLANA
ncbi:hypothetical protein FACS1894191_8520 [Clostridia bacterium]|nr:hypothetical protein FACS1894191_8520 [Clostridia bacterium]